MAFNRTSPFASLELLIEKALAEQALSAITAEQIYQGIRQGQLNHRERQLVALLRDAIAHQQVQVLAL